MAENKKSFIFYSDWIDTFKELPKDKGYDLLMHILAYVNDENPETDDFVISAIFAQMKNALKRDLRKWEDQRMQRSEAGKRSAEVRKAKKNERSTVVNENERKPTVSVNDNVNVKVNVNDKDIYKEFDFFKGLFKQIWINEFLPLKKKKKASLTDRALKSQLNKIKEFSENNYNKALMILEKSVNSGWTDFYKQKGNNFNTLKGGLQKDQSDFSTPDTGWNKK